MGEMTIRDLRPAPKSIEEAIAELADVVKVVAHGVSLTVNAGEMRAQIERCDQVINDMLYRFALGEEAIVEAAGQSATGQTREVDRQERDA